MSLPLGAMWAHSISLPGACMCASLRSVLLAAPGFHRLAENPPVVRSNGTESNESVGVHAQALTVSVWPLSIFNTLPALGSHTVTVWETGRDGIRWFELE